MEITSPAQAHARLQQGDRGRQGAGDLCRRGRNAVALADGVSEPSATASSATAGNAERAAARSEIRIRRLRRRRAASPGAALATGGDGKTVACATCHGPLLEGVAEVLRHHRAAVYLHLRSAQRHQDRYRQRVRRVDLMKPRSPNLMQDDMIVLAVFLGLARSMMVSSKSWRPDPIVKRDINQARDHRPWRRGRAHPRGHLRGARRDDQGRGARRSPKRGFPPR